MRELAVPAGPVRERLLAALGRLPGAPSAAPPRVDRRFVWDGIGFERWSFVGPRDEIRAWFLLAEGAAPGVPVLLALHPHGRQFEVGKSLVAGLVGDESRAYGLAAARAGFAVLAPDLPGFEDRRPPLADRKRNFALQGEAYERTLATSALVRGETLQGWILADLSACLDAVCADPRVDASRVGSIGQSFGGQETLFAMAIDDRIRAGFVSCGFSLVRLLVERSISHNLALYVPGLLPGLDFDVLVPSIAPRHLRLLAGRRDSIYPVEGVEAVEAVAREAWRTARRPERLVVRYHDEGHDLPPAELDAALEWMGEALAA